MNVDSGHLKDTKQPKLSRRTPSEPKQFKSSLHLFRSAEQGHLSDPNIEIKTNSHSTKEEITWKENNLSYSFFRRVG